LLAADAFAYVRSRRHPPVSGTCCREDRELESLLLRQ
jgi:hypothetical protein